MQTYFRILRYAKRYWKHITASVVCTVFYSVFSGTSIYLFIPLLDVLFHPEKINTGQVSETLKIPFGLGSLLQHAKEAFVQFVAEKDALRIVAAQKDGDFTKIPAVVDDIIDQRPERSKAEASGDHDEIVSFEYAYRETFAERSADTDFIPDIQPV